MPERDQQGPTGDVQYDKEALKEADERMHTQGTGNQGDLPSDPEGGHDPEALRDAAEKMLHREPKD